MADTAAFFAKKKKKKKAFKFNANNIDVATVSSTVHVDAPALSTDHEPSSVGLPAVSSLSVADTPENGKAAGDEWDDEALAAATSSKRGPIASSPATTELLDMKALDPKRSESDNIAEKLRLEETKAKLAAAREGMEREAQRIKEEEQKKLDAASGTSSGATPGGEGGRWVPTHMRGRGMGGGVGSGLPKIRFGGAAASAQKLDTKDENLFPDLATADKLLEEQQKSQQAAFKPPKKTPVGGRATWGSRPPLNLKKKEETKEEPKQEPEPPAPAPEPTPAPTEVEKPAAPAPVEAPAPAAGGVKPVAKKKKKKKDLSTFKPGG